MSSPIATIKIRNLRLRTYIGFNPDEKKKRQDVVINIEISYRVKQSVLNDAVEDALNYKTLTKRVIQHVEEGKFLLLEKLVADVLQICSAHSSVEHACVGIDKPNALRFADSVSVSLDYHADQFQSIKLLEKAS